MQHPTYSDAVLDRFWAKVAVSDDVTACWVWQATRTRAGYGQFWLGQKMESAHRVAYTLTHGPIPDGLFVMHACDNPLCVNPAHLSLGTPSENVADMIAKGHRRALGYTRPAPLPKSRPLPKGP